jgi:hypothetical protein
MQSCSSFIGCNRRPRKWTCCAELSSGDRSVAGEGSVTKYGAEMEVFRAPDDGWNPRSTIDPKLVGKVRVVSLFQESNVCNRACGCNGAEHRTLHGAVAAPCAREYKNVHSAREACKKCMLLWSHAGCCDVSLPASGTVSMR